MRHRGTGRDLDSAGEGESEIGKELRGEGMRGGEKQRGKGTDSGGGGKGGRTL